MTTIINKEEAMLAVKDGCALQYVSIDLRADKEVVMCAVVEDSYVLCYASEKLQIDLKMGIISLLKECEFEPKTYMKHYSREDNVVWMRLVS